MVPHSTLAKPLLATALLLLALLCVSGQIVSAQTSTTFGRHFLVAFPDTAQSHALVLYNTITPDASITLYALDTSRVSITGPGGYARTVIVDPGRSETVSLLESIGPNQSVFVDVRDSAVGRTFELRSDRPIAVTASFLTIHGAETFTPLPVEVWGREYFAASLDHQFIFHATQLEEKYSYVFAPAELLVIAAADSTVVTIEATTEVLGAERRTVLLNAGEAYLVETAPPPRPDTLVIRDVSGTRISASQPIGVISGNTRTLGSRENPLPMDPLPTNSMSNAAIEWIPPVDLNGHTFIYRQHSAVEELTTAELIRVYATAPGTTIVTTTNGPPMSVQQGSYLEFSSRTWRTGAELQPFAIRSDRPTQAFVWSGSFARTLPESSPGTEMETHTWSPAMSELTPRERWISFGLVKSPTQPPGTNHMILVVADSGATVTIDGAPIAFDATPVIGTSFRHARVPVASGDHFIRSSGGRCAATAFGQRRGYAAFRPLGARGDSIVPAAIADAGPRAVAMHPSYYLEVLAVAYAMPVPGVYELEPPRDSLVFERDERCDSTVVHATRLAPSWASGILEAELDPSSVNVDALITPAFAVNMQIGYRIRFMPRDPNLAADGAVIIRNDAGQTWTVPYSYRPETVTIAPAPIELLAVPAGVESTLTLTITNQKPFTTTVIAMHFRYGGMGFSLRPPNAVPRALRAGESFTVTLAFTGAEAGRHYLDSLVVISVCDSFAVAVSARTAPVAEEPVPLISGYDWRERRVGSVNDTLSFVSNAGSRAFAPADISIAGTGAAAFSLVDPDWRQITSVPPGMRLPLGIRFLPPAEGEFVAEIVMITDGDMRVSAELRGVGVASHVSLPDNVLTLCFGAEKEVLLTLSTAGPLPVRVDSLTVRGSSTTDISVDTTSLSLPRLLRPGGWLPVRVRLSGRSPGPLDALLIAHTDAIGDTIGVFGGDVVLCENPDLQVSNFDFGTVLVSFTRGGVVAALNSGDEPVAVTAMRIVDDPASAFRFVAPPLPITVGLTDTIRIPVEFTPPTEGAFTARIEYTTSIGRLFSQLSGVGIRLVVPIGIRRDYHGEPGTEHTVFVELFDTLPGYRLDSVSVSYDPALLDLIEATSANAAISVIDVDATRGLVLFKVAQSADTLAPGTLLALHFLVRISTVDSSELPVAIESNVPWLSFQRQPGLFKRDPWCGLQERMFEFVPGATVLRPVSPSPVSATASIEFSLLFAGATTLTIVDALGHAVVTLLDEVLDAGEYRLELPSGRLASGVYFVRLVSGGASQIQRFLVE